MKKVLYVSTAMMLVAGAASAEVTISGNARAGLTYDDTRTNEWQVETRLRFNIDASKETDAGVKLGGRIRIQSDENDSQQVTGFSKTTTGTPPVTTVNANNTNGASINSALLYAETAGFRVEVGNANTAYDSMGTLYNSEIGLTDSSFGDPAGSYFSYSTDAQSVGYMGVYVSYDIDGFSIKGSVADPDQENKSTSSTETETQFSVSYAMDAFQVGLGGVWNGAGISGNDIWSLVGEYAVNDQINVGLQYHDYTRTPSGNTSERITLYGNYALDDGIGIGAYIANDNSPKNSNDIAGGIGASYDIGGATVAGAIHSGYNDNVFADLGVKFSF